MRRKEIVPVILITVLALVIAVGGVGIGLAWKTNYLDKWLPPNIKERFGRGEKPEEKPEEDPTKDWKTYSNPEADFTFKYPPSWKIKEDYLYETPAGEEAEHRTVILIQTGKESNKISINEPQFPSDWENCRAEWVGPHWIGTCNEATEVLEVLDKVVSSFRSTR